MTVFKKRNYAPSGDNAYWVHTSKGGKNECILIAGKSCLPNCVGYAWGRFYELTGKKPKLSKANAEDWYTHKDGYKRSKSPKLGSVACWSKGRTANSKDGCGHVAIVEEIHKDGSIIISESGYNSFRFRTTKLKKPYNLDGYSFQGFIEPPCYAKGVDGVEVTLPILKKGMSGTEVKTIQRLCYCIYGCPEDLKIDGVFGNMTEKYVKFVQRSHRISVDGIVGIDTWNKLLH